MFVYILGAIFLLGILIVIVKGSFQEGSGIDGEKNALLVGQVQRYGAELERGVNYILQSGYSEADIRFAHPNANPGYGLITDIPTRQIFDPAGGGVEWKAPPTGSQVAAEAWYFNARSGVTGVGTSCAANSCVDLVATLRNVTKSFCLAVNQANDITNPLGPPPVEVDTYSYSQLFNGTYLYNNSIDVVGGYTAGKSEGCFSMSGIYYYYRVLLAR